MRGRTGGAMLGLFLLLAMGGCRGEPPGRLTSTRLDRLLDSLRPAVEQASGLTFRTRPRSILTTREAVRGYLMAKVDKEFPKARLEGLEAAYRLLGLLPDTLDLSRLLLSLYSEQVAGYYDPDSTALFAVQGGDPSALRLVMAHEMVHALQDQYLSLDSLLDQSGNGDTEAAAQAVLEGQATIASIRVLTPGQDLLSEPGFWDTYREQIQAQQTRMPVFAGAPLVLREDLIFPYVSGAEFMKWWEDNRRAPLPSPADLPRSTEEILHPARYAAGDRPVALVFADSGADVLYQDTFGELELQILATVLRGGDVVSYDVPLGWGGDRYRVYRSDGGPVLIWYSVWDEPRYAERFYRILDDGLPPPAGYRVQLERLAIGGRQGIRAIVAPVGWKGTAPEIQ